jgi:hypothetical protein
MKGLQVVKVPVVEKTKNSQTDSTWLELTPAGIKGRIQQHLTGYFSMHMRGRLLYTRQDDLKQMMKARLSRGSNKFQLDSLRMGSLSNPASIGLSAWFLT